MEQKIIKVYYNENGLPFQDLELTKPYSIVGSEFTGANNATDIRFYVSNIDNSYTWVANIKLQDGTMTYRLLTSATDEEDQPYKLLGLDNGITAKKGFIYVGLNGYGGETLIEEVEGVLTINGNPIIVATGTISIALNYNPVVIPLGTSIEPTEIQQILANLSQKLEQDDLDTALEDYLPLSGGTMSGAIVQPIAPVADNDLANKKYVDDSVKVATDDIADIIDGDLTVHTAYHAEMDVYGNVIPTYYQPKLTFDNTPTASSTNPVKSSGIKSYVDGKVDSSIKELGTFLSVIDLLNATTSATTLQHGNVLDGAATQCWYVIVLNGIQAIAMSGYTIRYYEKLNGTTWTLITKFALDTQVGSKLYLNPTDYKLYLRNSANANLSMVDLPLESVVVSGSYDDLTQSLVLTLQNGTNITIPVADLVDGLVPNTRTIAGVDLVDDITASELNTALGIAKTDIVVNTADYVSLELDSKPVQVRSAIEDKNGNDITTTYALQSDMNNVQAVIPANATALNPLIARSDAVKIMTAPASETLTNEQITQFINGIYINGTFLGYVNPVFYPARVTDATYYYGVLCGASEVAVAMERVYRINKTTKVIDLATYTPTTFSSDGRAKIQIWELNNAKFPASNPSGTEPYDLTIANNIYSFRERIYEYANMYLSNNATAVSLTADTLTKFAIPMTGGASNGITISTANDNLTILKTGVYQIIVTFNTSVSVNDLTLEAGVYKNISTAIPELKQIRTAKNASTIDTSTLQGIVSLTANDVIDIRVKAGGNCDMTVINATISVRRVS